MENRTFYHEILIDHNMHPAHKHPLAGAGLCWWKKDRRRETAPPIPGHKAHYCVQIQKPPTDYLSCRP